MRPLEGCKVLSFAHAWAAPYGTMMLADMGADVVKVEAPKLGDHTRRWTRNDLKGISPHFVSVNRNKRSIQLDLAQPEGRDVALRLATEADVLVENFSPGTLERFALGYRDVEAVNPGIVYCSVSGYGATGPYAGRRAYDLLLQAESGIMSVTGDRKGEYAKVGVAAADVASAMVAAFSVACALVSREHTGKGAHIDMSMLEVASSMMAFNVADYSISGKVPEPLGTAHPLLAPYQAYETQTEPIVICILTDRHWEKFCELVERPDLVTREEFRTAPMRVEYRDELNVILDEIFAQHPREYWDRELNARGLACGALRDVEGLLSHPQHLERDFLETYEHHGVEFKIPGKPWAYGDARTAPCTPPPEHAGEHGPEVLHDWLGMSDDDVRPLLESGAVSISRPE